MSRNYFTEQELNPKGHPLSDEVKANLAELARRVSLVREEFAAPMVVTSGFRSEQDQRRIYKNATRVPLGSMHLVGCAVDIADRDGQLAEFVTSHVALLEKAGLWCEDVTKTRGWVHFQLRPPRSGSRFFLP